MTSYVALDGRFTSIVFNPDTADTRVHCDPLSEEGLRLYSPSGLIVWSEGLRGRGQLASPIGGECFAVKGPASLRSVTIGGVPYLDVMLESDDGTSVHEMRIPAVDVIMVAPLDDAEQGHELVREELSARKFCLH